VRPPPFAASRLLAPLALGALALVFWWFRIVVPAAAPDLTTTDLRLFFYPTYLVLFGRLADGELPLWNPYQLCGLPALGSPQGGLFYPPHLLFLVLPSNVALAVLAVGHLLFLVLSTVWFARRVGLSATAAALAAVSFAFGGVVRGWLLEPPLLEAVAWLPFGAIAVVDLVRRPGARVTARLAAATAMSWLAGGPQATVYVLYAWSTLWLAILIGERPPASRWLVAGALYAGAIALGTLTAGAQLVPAVEMAGQGVRALHPLGGSRAELWTFVTNQTTGPGSRFSPVALVLLAAVPFARGRRALGWWCLLVGGFALVLAEGPLTPIFPVYFALPAIAWFRNPGHLLLLTDFTIAIAAAIALDVLWTRDAGGGRRFGAARLAVVATAIALVAGRLRWGVHLPVLLPAAVALLAIGPWRRSPAAAVIVLALAVAEAFLAPPNTALLPYRGAGAAEYGTADDVYAGLRAQLGSDRVWIMREPFMSGAFAPKLASVHRVRSLDDYEAITLRRQAEYFTWLLERRSRPALPNTLFAGMLTTNIATATLGRLRAQRRLLDLTATRLILMPIRGGGPLDPLLPMALRLRPLPSPRADLALFENPSSLPRAFVTYRAATAPPMDVLLKRLSAPTFDPLQASYVEASPLPPDDAAPARGRPATIVRDDEEVVEIEATLDAPGLVVLADSFYPGWRATVDDVPAEILATNHLFRGVRAPAGTHRVRFVYRPASVLIGRGASFAGLIILATLFVAPAFGRGRRPAQPS
jgi:hypothetical protein